LTARLASAAGGGELLASIATAARAGRVTDGLERRDLTLRGKSEAMEVVVLRA
jgi:class 3 adenylate cyclase